MKNKSLVACTLAFGLAVSPTANAALNAYLTVKGQTQGPIQGSVTQKGREGKIMVIAVDHNMKVAKGKAQHGVFVITKELDKSTPLLMRALVHNENLDLELQFWTPQLGAVGGGSEKQHYTVKLTGARIVDHDFKMLNNKNPENTRFAEHEVISFTYEKIEWQWVDGGISTSSANGP